MKSIKNIIVATLVLTIICAVSAGALALTNDITKDRIASANRKAEQTAMAKMIKGAEFKEDKVTVKDVEHTYYEAKVNDETKGYIFTLTGKGYGGDLKVMVGFDPNGTIIGVKVLEANDETPGLGQNVTKNDFLSQFTGGKAPLEVKKQINAVTGATISSRGVTECVNFAAELLNEVLEDGQNGK